MNIMSLILARQRVQRSLKVALIVGSILGVINHSDKILAQQMQSLDWFKFGITYLVPYAVSTYASISEFLNRQKELSR